MSDIELMVAAVENTEAARTALHTAVEVGQARPVLADYFTRALVHQRAALSATTELERRARGGVPAKVGEHPEG